MTFKDTIRILDTTLRDGEQAVGVIFTPREKRQTATLLAEMGVTTIEAGFPALGAEEKKSVIAVTQAGIEVGHVGLPRKPLCVYGFARAKRDDVRHAAECEVSGVVISVGTSDILIQRKLRRSREWILDQVEEAAAEAEQHGLDFIVSAEDASRTELPFLLEYYRRAEGLGASTVRYCDSLGIDNPVSTYQRLRSICQEVSVPVEVHVHNDFGMATANVLAGIRAGARSVSASIGGLGERVGNPPLEEVVMALKYLYGVDVGIDTTRFREIAEYVAEASHRAIPIWKAIIGTNVFAHESGIHADGILKNPANYEAFTPEAVGLERQMVIGKHSGTNALIHKFNNQFRVPLGADDAERLLERVRSTALELKRTLFDKELVLLYQELTGTTRQWEDDPW